MNTSEMYAASQGANILNIIKSMFMHFSVRDLLQNIVPLYIFGYDAFCDSKSPVWRNGVSLFVTFFGAGILGFLGHLHLSLHLQSLWNDKIESTVARVSAEHGWPYDMIINKVHRFF